MIVTNQEIRLYASEIVERTTNTADQINSGTRDILITLQKRKKCATTKSAENASSLEYSHPLITVLTAIVLVHLLCHNLSVSIHQKPWIFGRKYLG